MEKTKKPRGRPPKEQEEVLVQRSIRLQQHLWDKVDSVGLSELRKLLERWKPKPNT